MAAGYLREIGRAAIHSATQACRHAASHAAMHGTATMHAHFARSFRVSRAIAPLFAVACPPPQHQGRRPHFDRLSTLGAAHTGLGGGACKHVL